MATKKVFGASALSALTIALVGGAGTAQAAVPTNTHLARVDLSSLSNGGTTQVATLADTLNHDHFHDHDSSARAAAAAGLSGTFNV